MAHALALGRRGLGRVAPWPSVGCVIVRDGRIVGRGTSDPKTLRHAEIVALDQAAEAAKDATVYVTLEPCSHQGRTPPCADALIKAGVARVVVATSDPNPLVAGKGLEKLRSAGIDVVTGVCEAEACADQAGFLSVHTRGRPTLTLKLATTLDGRIATATGESQWITGPEARRKVHSLRASHDCVMVGGGTARADNPSLTVRDADTSAQPVRLVVSRRLSLPWPSKLVETTGQSPVWIVHGDGDADPADMKRWREAGAKLLPVPAQTGQINLTVLLTTLADEGLTRVFCEGGGAFAASLLAAGLVDDLIVFTAGKVFGAEGQPGIGALGVSQLANAPVFDLVETARFGADVMHHWRARA
ncbi:MAG: bifunctional diaminohydroxyphosphoribosylaminopyrimidine deaminase/5-amino-6-(5-phosphoribosylamino)uracil reductase RibD [Silicimonas sp.]|nr:bifunctional diaminohydroxyphosphoribosylaminopyrimidine deaminase/5-amino-6-(5-phosphoribosylamino)uracil reductase RibD [Silicimonas sp.]